MVTQQHASSVKRGPAVESFQVMHARRESFMVTVVGDLAAPLGQVDVRGQVQAEGATGPAPLDHMAYAAMLYRLSDHIRAYAREYSKAAMVDRRGGAS